MRSKKKVLIQSQIEPELKKIITQMAKKERLSVSTYVKKVLWDLVEQKAS